MKNCTRLMTEARRFAYDRHQGQTRKYTNVPYFDHCMAVAEMVAVKATPEDGDLEALICAAYLHDTIEDTETTSLEIMNLFPKSYQLVCALTDYYTHESFPDMPRDLRKLAEADRLGEMSKILPGLRLIKWCDLIDNTKSIVEHDPKFSIVYLREKANVLEALGFDK